MEEADNSDIATEISMWVEVKSKNNRFKKIFRNYPLFRKKNSDKFDHILLICRKHISIIKKLTIKPVCIQLGLIENVTYLFKEVTNDFFFFIIKASGIKFKRTFNTEYI